MAWFYRKGHQATIPSVAQGETHSAERTVNGKMVGQIHPRELSFRMPFKDPDKQRAWQRDYQRRNPIKRKQSHNARRQEFQKIKEATPCADCNLLWPYYVMQYDHVRGEKVATVSSLLRTNGFAAAFNEIEKCDLVCGNCHAIRTHKRLHG